MLINTCILFLLISLSSLDVFHASASYTSSVHSCTPNSSYDELLCLFHSKSNYLSVKAGL